MKITKTSSNGISLIKTFEGFSATPYKDVAGISTIGFGTIRYPNGNKVSLDDPEITEYQAIQYLKHDVEQFELAVDAMAIDTLTQNQFDSLVSFSYNLGSNALKKSTLLKRVNSGTGNIRAAFMMWTYANGKQLAGLKRRRAAEADLYLS